MREALGLAREAAGAGEIPVGAIVVDAAGRVLGRGRNRSDGARDATAHAEVVAIREACARFRSARLDDCTLVTTLEPCVMCAGAALVSRIDVIVFGAWDAKAGAAGSVYDLPRDRRIPVSARVYGGVLGDECAALLAGFFAERRPAGS